MTNDELTRLFPLVRTGDERACEQLWQGMNIPVYTVAMRILDDKYLAEDVTQEVFVKLFRNPPGDEVRNPRAWIFKVTHNAALGCLERQRIRRTDELDEATAPALTDDWDVKLDIDSALARLDSVGREIVTLRAVADLGFREISEATGLTVGTVYFRYRRAIAKLRDWLS